MELLEQEHLLGLLWYFLLEYVCLLGLCSTCIIDYSNMTLTFFPIEHIESGAV